MSRELVWIEQQGLRCWGCSECAWVFNPSGALTGKSLDESKRNFELQRDKEFTLHVCADHPRAKSESTKHEVRQDWEKLYRAAIIEPDRRKLLQRVEDTEAAIRERSRRLSKSPANSGKEQEAITRALHILSLLRAKAGD
jgi:Fe-S-cluster-containing hydrogenase component 2